MSTLADKCAQNQLLDGNSFSDYPIHLSHDWDQDFKHYMSGVNSHS